MYFLYPHSPNKLEEYILESKQRTELESQSLELMKTNFVLWRYNDKSYLSKFFEEVRNVFVTMFSNNEFDSPDSVINYQNLITLYNNNKTKKTTDDNSGYEKQFASEFAKLLYSQSLLFSSKNVFMEKAGKEIVEKANAFNRSNEESFLLSFSLSNDEKKEETISDIEAEINHLKNKIYKREFIAENVKITEIENNFSLVVDESAVKKGANQPFLIINDFFLNENDEIIEQDADDNNGESSDSFILLSADKKSDGQNNKLSKVAEKELRKEIEPVLEVKHEPSDKSANNQVEDIKTDQNNNQNQQKESTILIDDGEKNIIPVTKDSNKEKGTFSSNSKKNTIHSDEKTDQKNRPIKRELTPNEKLTENKPNETKCLIIKNKKLSNQIVDYPEIKDEDMINDEPTIQTAKKQNFQTLNPISEKNAQPNRKPLKSIPDEINCLPDIEQSAAIENNSDNRKFNNNNNTNILLPGNGKSGEIIKDESNDDFWNNIDEYIADGEKDDTKQISDTNEGLKQTTIVKDMEIEEKGNNIEISEEANKKSLENMLNEFEKGNPSDDDNDEYIAPLPEQKKKPRRKTNKQTKKQQTPNSKTNKQTVPPPTQESTSMFSYVTKIIGLAGLQDVFE